MKGTRFYCLFGLAAALLVIVLWFLLSFGNIPVKPQMQAGSSSQPEAGAQQETHSTNTESGPTSSQEIKKHIRSLAYQPIEFYGKLVDQFGNPVTGAEVTGSVLAGDGTSTNKTTTDGVGLFQFKGLKGMSLGIMARKSGYEFVAKNTGFDYALFRPEKVHKPDPNNPVVFKMWKLSGPEPMIEGQKFFKIKPNGPDYTIDLVNGKKIEGRSEQGDFIVQIHRPSVVGPKDRYDWSFEIKPIDGGVIEADDPFPYLAPEAGYKPTYLHVVSTSEPGWTYRIRKSFYLKSRGGKIHARIQLEAFADYPGGAALDLHYYVNPNGSRNLEWDPSKKMTKDEIAKLNF